MAAIQKIKTAYRGLSLSHENSEAARAAGAGMSAAQLADLFEPLTSIHRGDLAREALLKLATSDASRRVMARLKPLEDYG